MRSDFDVVFGIMGERKLTLIASEKEARRNLTTRVVQMIRDKLG